MFYWMSPSGFNVIFFIRTKYILYLLFYVFIICIVIGWNHHTGSSWDSAVARLQMFIKCSFKYIMYFGVEYSLRQIYILFQGFNNYYELENGKLNRCICVQRDQRSKRSNVIIKKRMIMNCVCLFCSRILDRNLLKILFYS